MNGLQIVFVGGVGGADAPELHGVDEFTEGAVVSRVVHWVGAFQIGFLKLGLVALVRLPRTAHRSGRAPVVLSLLMDGGMSYGWGLGVR